jgi:hypothetical protein
MLRAMLSIDGRDLRVREGSGGKKSVVLDVAAVVFDVSNQVVVKKDQKYDLELPESQAGLLAESAVTYQIDLAIPKPGPYDIRMAVRDDQTNAAGSAGAFVDVPDFNKQRLSLSSVTLAESGDGIATGQVRIARRNFRTGHRIDYGFRVYGATAAKPGGAQEVEVELRLFRDGAQVFASQRIPVAPDPGAREMTIVGSFTLPAGFPEGEYMLQVTAHDGLADSKKGSASQWVEMTLGQ